MSSRLQGLTPAAAKLVVATAQALEAGRPVQAAQSLAGVLASHPDHPEALRLEAGMLSLRSQHADAVRAMQRALAQRPDDALYHNTMGTVLAAAGFFDGAIEALRHACMLQPDLAIGWYNLGIILTRCVRYAEAREALRQAVNLAPDHVLARAQLADMLRVEDRADEAAAEYRRVLAVQPWAGMAWWGLADLKTVRFEDGDIARMRAAVVNPQASDDDRIATGFALAKACDEAGCFAEALAAIAAANGLARRRRKWNAAAFSALATSLDRAFGAIQADAQAHPSLGREVVFIVGMPRSGSTLVEQILASHSQVEGAGELPDLAHVIAEESRRRGNSIEHWARALAPADWERLGRRYLERTAHWRRHRPVFTDKMPNNWLYLGAIRAMLPAAPIVCTRRDPLETCFACYRQHFAGNDYTRTFADLAAYWRDYDRSVRLWSQRAPAWVHAHGLEELVAAPDVSIRRLLEFCGLPFEQACLRFHETRRDVRSPSAMQVRQPLRSDSARAPRYAALLDPLRAALGMPAFGGLPSG